MSSDRVHPIPPTERAAERYRQAHGLFLGAIDQPACDRDAWLAEQCGDDGELYRQVQSLLAADADFDEMADAPTCEMQQAVRRLRDAYRDLPAAEPQQPDELPTVPGYEVLGVVARGGMGVVYKARQLRPPRLVVLKMMRSGQFATSGDRSRFLAEAELAAQLDDAAVVPVYELGQMRGEPFIAMKYIEGENLEQALARNNWSPDEIVGRLLPVCWTVAAAHKRGIIHRDLKPSNLLVEQHSQTMWVTDFGLAKNLNQDAAMTAAGDVLGTPSYMAPEQALAEAPTPATDVYGLGAVLYRALTGRPLRETGHGGPEQVLKQIRENHVVPPRVHNRRVSKALNSVCMKCLETDPRSRYADAGELADDLERLVDGDAVLARPMSPGRQVHQWARTHPGLAVSWAAIALFFTYHMVQVGIVGRGTDGYEMAVTVVSAVGMVAAWFWQHQLKKTGGRPAVLYAWVTSDVTLVTALALNATPDNNRVVMLFPIMVAASALRFRPSLVWYVTTIAIFGYLVRTAGLHLVGGEVWQNAIPFMLCMAVLGGVQYLVLRHSAASLEARSASQIRLRRSHGSTDRGRWGSSGR